jgi:hypothetical protein
MLLIAYCRISLRSTVPRSSIFKLRKGGDKPVTPMSPILNKVSDLRVGATGWFAPHMTYGNFVQENPEIFASHDEIHWTIPDGVKNPLIPSPQGAWDHNSDPDIFLDGKLWLYYRETRPISAPPENRIYLTTGVDGVAWTSPAPRCWRRVETRRSSCRRPLSTTIVRSGCGPLKNTKTNFIWCGARVPTA